VHDPVDGKPPVGTVIKTVFADGHTVLSTYTEKGVERSVSSPYPPRFDY
jgi:hypothetical protein